MEVKTVPGGLIMSGEGKIEEIRVELSLELNLSFKNQVVKVSGYWGSTYSHLSDGWQLGIWPGEVVAIYLG